MPGTEVHPKPEAEPLGPIPTAGDKVPAGHYYQQAPNGGLRLRPFQSTVDEAVKTLLRHVGEDPERSGLMGTPGRVTRALVEMTSGYREDPKEILSRTFEETYDEIVIVTGVPFTSLCEHHLLPFLGTADVGYLPGQDKGKVVGLSKLARLVDCFAKRLQLQERMTKEIADSISIHLEAQGVAVVVRATHSCMACRGVRKSGAEMVTSCMLGVFRDKAEARAEFLALCKG